MPEDTPIFNTNSKPCLCGWPKPHDCAMKKLMLMEEWRSFIEKLEAI